MKKLTILTTIITIFIVGLGGSNYPLKAEAITVAPSFYRTYQTFATMEKEIWKDVKGYEGLYQISNIGNVKSLTRKSYDLKNIKGKVLKACCDGNNRLFVSLRKSNKSRQFTVHMLMAIAFLDHKPDGTHKIVVDHINNIKTDNALSNLQLITNRENVCKDKDKTKTSSKYIGVCWSKSHKIWCSKIRVGKKRKYLGYFHIEKEASEAYQIALKELNHNK